MFARLAADGSMVRLADQDRSRWDRDLIAEGHDLVRACLRRNQPGPFQIQAAIAAVHADAPTAADTDWGRIATLYAALEELTGSPVVRLNRAVAVAEVAGPAAGLDLLDGLDLPGFHLLPATRADLLRRLDRPAEARRHYEEALALAGNAADRDFLTSRLAALEQDRIRA